MMAKRASAVKAMASPLVPGEEGVLPACVLVPLGAARVEVLLEPLLENLASLARVLAAQETLVVVIITGHGEGELGSLRGYHV